MLGWRNLNVAWALYFVVVFTVGRTEEYTRWVIWGGGLLVGVPTMRAMLAERVSLSTGPRILWAFGGWSLLGLLFVADVGSFWSYFSLVVELAAIVSFVSVMVARSEGPRVWYLAFTVVGAVNATAAGMLGSVSDVLGGVAVERQSGIAGNPNALGLSAFLGVLGALVLAGAEERGWRTVTLLLAGVASAYGVLLSGSRAALLGSALTVVGWPIVCGGRQLRSPWLVGAAMAVTVAGVETGVFSRLEESTMGQRVGALREGRDNSAEVRQELMTRGLTLLSENPVMGVGLGQFASASETAMYAHSEWIELLATTGLPGFAIYMTAMLRVGWQLGVGAARSRDHSKQYFAKAGRLCLGVVLVTGAVTWPHFLTIHSMFLLGVVYGTAAMLIGDRGYVRAGEGGWAGVGAMRDEA